MTIDADEPSNFSGIDNHSESELHLKEDLREDEDRTTKKTRKAIKRVAKHLRMEKEDESPTGFDFPSKEDVLALKKKQREKFFDHAAACSEKIVGLTSRILTKFGQRQTSNSGSSGALRLSMKGFEQTELWRQVSAFSRKCCAKALRTIDESSGEKLGAPNSNPTLAHADQTEYEEDETDDEDEDEGAGSQGEPAGAGSGPADPPQHSEVRRDGHPPSGEPRWRRLYSTDHRLLAAVPAAAVSRRTSPCCPAPPPSLPRQATAPPPPAAPHRDPPRTDAPHHPAAAASARAS